LHFYPIQCKFITTADFISRLERLEIKMGLSVFYLLGFALIVVGVIVVVLALILASTRGSEKGKAKVRGAGVIMIGPIPIIFGNNKKALKGITILAIILTVLLLILTILRYLG
jgi:uncharacterized protein (TIGR00304 family)